MVRALRWPSWNKPSDRAVGHLWLGVRPQPSVLGLGYWVIPSARRRGIARHATTLAARWAFSDLAAARLEALVDPHNEPSLRLLASVGFVEEGLVRSSSDDSATRRDMTRPLTAPIRTSRAQPPFTAS